MATTDTLTGAPEYQVTDPPAGWSQDNAILDFLSTGGLLVLPFADAATRTTKLGTPSSTSRVMTVLRAEGRVDVWDGTAHRPLQRLAAIDADPVTAEQTYGAATGLNNTSLVQITTYAWTWTPSQSGIAAVSYVADVQQTTAGWGSFVLVPVRSGVAMAGGKRAWYEAGTTRSELAGVCAPFRVTGGAAVPLTMNCAVFSASGVVKVNSLSWTATVVPD